MDLEDARQSVLRELGSRRTQGALRLQLRNSAEGLTGFDENYTPGSSVQAVSEEKRVGAGSLSVAGRLGLRVEQAPNSLQQQFSGSDSEARYPLRLEGSAAVLGWPSSHRDWARPGIMLYGADPMPGEGHELRPVMSLHSAVMAVRELPAGAPLGYGARFVAERPTRVGLVAMGYADGYPRTVPDGTPVAVDGQAASLIGRVSMDMLTVDLTDLPGAGIGSAVELWGPQVPVNRIAEAAGTISYELLCNVKRARFEYTN